MNIYLLTRLTEEPRYDVNDGHVVVAKHHIQARKLASEVRGDEGSETWLSAYTSSIQLLATDSRVKRAGVILSDFNAG